MLEKEQLYKTIKDTARLVPHRLEDIIKHKPELIDDKEVGELIQKTMISKGLQDPDVQKLIRIGIDKADLIRKTAFKKAVDAMKVTDVENLSIDTIKNKDFQEMVVRFKDSRFIREIGETKGAEYIEMLQSKAEEIGIEEIAKSNSTFLRAPYTPGGALAGMRPWKDYSKRQEIEELIKKQKLLKGQT